MKQSVVTGVVVTKGDLILLVKKPAGVGPYPGKYLTPGGGVNVGEDIDQSVLRELYEETGVKINNLKRQLFDAAVTNNWKGDPTHFIMLLYTGDYVSGNLQPTAGDDDHLAEIAWFSPQQLSKLSLSPPLSKFLRFLGYQL